MESKNKVAILCGLGGLGAIIYGLVHAFSESELDDHALPVLFSGVFFELFACKLYSPEAERELVGENEAYISAP